MSDIKQYTIEELSLGMRVSLDSMDDILNVIIVLGDITTDDNTGVIKYIGTDEDEAADVIETCNPVCIIHNIEEEGVDYDE